MTDYKPLTPGEIEAAVPDSVIDAVEELKHAVAYNGHAELSRAASNLWQAWDEWRGPCAENMEGGPTAMKPEINLYPEMNAKIADFLWGCDEGMCLYAAAYIDHLTAERDHWKVQAEAAMQEMEAHQCCDTCIRGQVYPDDPECDRCGGDDYDNYDRWQWRGPEPGTVSKTESVGQGPEPGGEG